MEQTTEKDQLELFSPAAALRAQIRSGYKSTDYALAEIIDNSIEAKAKRIDVYVVQGYVPPENPGEGSRGRQGILRIITVDDGCGIEPSTLSRVLTFGYGTHLDQTDGIIDGYGKLGKFGYGLPNASVCTGVGRSRSTAPSIRVLTSMRSSTIAPRARRRRFRRRFRKTSAIWCAPRASNLARAERSSIGIKWSAPIGSAPRR